VGDLFNLMSIDAKNIVDVIPFLLLFWSVPVQLLGTFLFLWNVLDGPSSLACVSVMVFLIPFNSIISTLVRKLYARQMKNKDKRVRLMMEVLNGIKSIKLYAWEGFFKKNLKDVRNKEIKDLKNSAYLQSISSSVCPCSLIVVIFKYNLKVLLISRRIYRAGS